ncbi:MAG TPA: hypothetical protein PK914_11460 [Smithellaceae bacterium]|nr:hypothetical protein [Smithellaceae bacterium]
MKFKNCIMSKIVKIRFLKELTLNGGKFLKGQEIEVITSGSKPSSNEIQKAIEKITGRGTSVGFSEGSTHEVLS